MTVGGGGGLGDGRQRCVGLSRARQGFYMLNTTLHAGLCVHEVLSTNV